MIALSRQSSIAAAVSAARPLYHLAKLTLSRFYTTAGAAQPQLDPDYHYDNNNNNRNNYSEWRCNRLGGADLAEAESVWGPVRGVQWAFIGSPLAKKHVYAETLSKFLQVPHISMASLVRQELHPRSSLYKQIANAVNRGELVQEDIIFGLLSKRLEDGYCRGESGFILDGIPRSQFQAEILDQLAEIDLVVNFKCTDDCLVNHQQEVVWKDKLRAYVERSKPLEDYYRKQKKLLDFQVASAPGETWKGLLASLHLQHIIPVYSPKRPTAAPRLL